jgi:hypothetical protein
VGLEDFGRSQSIALLGREKSLPLDAALELASWNPVTFT